MDIETTRRRATQFSRTQAALSNFGDRGIAAFVACGFHVFLLLLLLMSPHPKDAHDGGSGTRSALSVQFIAIDSSEDNQEPLLVEESLDTTDNPDTVPDEIVADATPDSEAPPLPLEEETKNVSKMETPASETRFLASAPNQAASAGSAQMLDSSHDENDLRARYHAALRTRITSMWSERTQRPIPQACLLSLELAPGGVLVSASASACELSEADRNQLEAAALMAQPMPYEGFESVFSNAVDLVL